MKTKTQTKPKRNLCPCAAFIPMEDSESTNEKKKLYNIPAGDKCISNRKKKPSNNDKDKLMGTDQSMGALRY